MSDAFICYSRKDGTFARALCEGLTARKLQVWMDVRDIPGGARWTDEVRAAIDAAGSFVYLASPRSVASKECDREVNFAADNRKPIVPVVIEAVPDDRLPAPVADFEFISISDNDALDQVAAAIRQDYVWKRVQSELLERARFWERGEGELLDGPDLGRAEQWLDQALQAGRAPSDLLRTFLARSREKSDERMRMQRAARSRLVALQVEEMVSDAPDLALLLAAEAVEIEPTLEAKIRLLRTLQHLGKLAGFMHQNPAPVNSLAFSPDGHYLAAIDIGVGPPQTEALIALWQPGQLRSLESIRTGRDHCNAVAYQPDGSLVAAAGFAWLGRWRPGSTHLESVEGVVEDDIRSIAFCPGSELLVLGTQGGHLEMWDLARRRRITRVDRAHDGFVDRVLCPPDGRRVWSAGRDNAIRCWDSRTLAPRRPCIAFDGQLVDITLAQGGDVLVAMDWNGKVVFYGVPSGKALGGASVDHGGCGAAVALDDRGEFLATGGGGGSTGGVALVTWNVAQKVPDEVLFAGFREGVRSLAFAPGNDLLAAGSTDGKISLWRLRERCPLGEPIDIESLHALDAAPDTPLLAGGTPDGRVLWIDFLENAVRTSARLWESRPVVQLEFAPDGSRVLAMDEEGTIALLPTLASAPSAVSPSAPRTPANGVAWSPDGARIVTVHEDGMLRIWDGNTLALVREHLAAHGSYADGKPCALAAVTFRPDGKNFVTAGMMSGDLVYRDAGTGLPLGDPVPAGGLFATSLRFVPGRKLLVTASQFQPLVLDAETGEFVCQCLGKSGDPAVDIDISPDGTLMSTCAADGLVFLWDTEAWTALDGLRGHGTAMRRARFTHDGTHVVSLDFAGRVIRWAVTLSAWKGRATNLANRTLTSEERRRHLAMVKT
jgi:WD40 repeat protein